MNSPYGLKTALVYEWLIHQAGGEKTLASIASAYPAPIYTLVHSQKHWGQAFSDPIYTSFIQKLPFSSTLYRHYLPLFPLAIEQFDFSSYDLVLSVSHAVAKGVLTTAEQLHLCYCFTPMRYAWDLTHRYLERTGPLQRALARPWLHYLRNWDSASANRVDHFATISRAMARRIAKIYRRSSTVIHPPVATQRAVFSDAKEEYYLTASRMVSYKRMDLIVAAFSHMPHRKLVVVGEGPERKRIEKQAKKNVEILGWRSDLELRELMQKAKGFIFAADEDFGIVSVEAQAAGTPVIAFESGGSLDTVIGGKTGLFFPEQTVRSLCDAIELFERSSFDPHVIRAHAQTFSEERFIKEFKTFVESKSREFYEIHHSCRRQWRAPVAPFSP